MATQDVDFLRPVKDETKNAFCHAMLQIRILFVGRADSTRPFF